MNKVINRIGVVVLTAFGFAACDDQLGVHAGAQTSLSFAATGGTTLLGSPTPPQNPVTVAGHVIAVSDLELRLSRLEIEGFGGVETEIRGDQILVALPVDGSLVTPVNATIAAGTYNQLELRVETVRVRGTFDGQPFDVTVAVDEDLEISIVPPLEVNETSQANLTVAVQVSDWFRAHDGDAINLLNLTATARARLASNIEVSFDAFDDQDRSGRSHDD